MRAPRRLWPRRRHDTARALLPVGRALIALRRPRAFTPLHPKVAIGGAQGPRLLVCLLPRVALPTHGIAGWDGQAMELPPRHVPRHVPRPRLPGLGRVLLAAQLTLRLVLPRRRDTHLHHRANGAAAGARALPIPTQNRAYCRPPRKERVLSPPPSNLARLPYHSLSNHAGYCPRLGPRAHARCTIRGTSHRTSRRTSRRIIHTAHFTTRGVPPCRYYRATCQT